MTQGTKVQRHIIIVLVLIFGIFCGSVIQASSISSGGAVKVLQVHQIANTLIAYQGDQFNVSLSITNVYGFQDIHNVTITIKIPSEIEFLNSSEPDLDPKIGNDTEEFNYDFGTLLIDEKIHFSVTYNVTSAETKSITLQAVNVTYRMENIGWDYVLSKPDEGLEIGLRGIRVFTTTPSLLPLPSGEIPAQPILSIIGYILPLIVFGMSIIVFRRIRYW